MANQEHLDLFEQGIEVWNQWRQENLAIQPDLTGSNLQRVDFAKANLREVNLSGAQLVGADLCNVDLSRANLSNSDLSLADFSQANLSGACLSKAKLTGANLTKANLSGADLSEAEFITAVLFQVDLSGANLQWARLVQTNLSGANLSAANLFEADLREAILSDADLSGADLTGCLIYAISAWNVQLKDTIQLDLIITNPDRNEPIVTVDNVEVAQFIYLLLNNQKIRDVIDTITSKVVLILGRFTPPRKMVLDTLRDELRKLNYTPVIFDFEKPASRDLTETVSTLAHLARFIIVDLTDPSSAPHEVATVIPHTVVPVQPLLLQEPLLVDGKVVERREYAMFEDLRRRYHWVLPTFRYQDTAELLAELQAQIIVPAEQKAKELTQPK